jgi:hypothetical protein
VADAANAAVAEAIGAVSVLKRQPKLLLQENSHVLGVQLTLALDSIQSEISDAQAARGL